jgi:hypothetical protein
MNSKYIFLSFLLVASLFTSCKSNKQATEEVLQPVGPAFMADSAMAYCEAQCDFGPRTMNSKAHDLCEEWIVNKFKGFGLEVETQKADLTGWDGTKLHSTNIIAHFNPQAERRILICAHWDSRPWADNDPDSTNWHKPVLAANDGASGVGVMLEVARLLQNDTTLAIGVDLVCFDAEDYGTPQWAEKNEDSENTWALGAQYWAKNLPENYKPQFGILLDMVGGQGAKFYQEQFSLRYAASIVDKVWSAARHAGYGSMFTNEVGGQITDDHIPVNEAGIPTVDIIPFYPDCRQSSFGPTWHTVNDDMEHLDINTLKAVGQTLIQVIYSE